MSPYPTPDNKKNKITNEIIELSESAGYLTKEITLDKRFFVVAQWWKQDKSSIAITAAFAIKYPGEIPPGQSMHALAKKFHETGYIRQETKWMSQSRPY